MSAMVDWKLAVTVGSRLAGRGPEVTGAQAAEAVAELRAGARRSTALVGDFTGLRAPADTAPVLVVDRAGWVQANADGFRTILDPITRKLSEKGTGGPLTHAIGSRVTGTEVGLLLGFLSGKVLGQFDPFHDPAGRLLLVAPNIVHVEREIGADPSDFRLWVCLHEETHRVQFTAVPWLRDHLLGLMEQIAETIQETGFEENVRRVSEALRSDQGSLLDAVSSPEQRAVLDQVTGVMSLLEGHADVVMDDVAPDVIRTVPQIRKAFNQRRGGVGTLDRLLRRLLGLDQKTAQYRDGAKFVRHVVDAAGMESFNTIWSGPEALPSKEEIHDPTLWMKRVL
ncbi:MAG: zinc-dependent metalloprotease [Nocardioides sp.]|uniref:zinc-dependent metalloprotease n=1 Tax=Nocardioides sp. TaxID=35761 RepID=UPI003F101AA9